MTLGVLAGAAAGAAGTTALNAATYLDMALRGRPASGTPQQLVETMAADAHVPIPGSGDSRDNRLSGLGPLFGTGVGVAVGTAAGVVQRALHRRGRRLPAPVAVVALAAAAMLLSDAPLKLFGISDPATWKPADWLSDALPHLAYGATTYATLLGTEAL
ncbi:hypothetical protein [Nakamurella endophytica]|nr:hypothetical protein [Nakamurella endophytica]